MGLGNIKKCRQCKELFSPSRKEKICPKCKQGEHEKFKIVKDYLWEHPGSNVEELHRETGVEKELIRKFVKEGRFVEVKGVSLSVDCEKCGKSIPSGRFCESCKNNLRKGFESAKKKSSKKKNKDKRDDSGMHLGDRHKRKQ